jgi:hypothetical protein
VGQLPRRALAVLQHVAITKESDPIYQATAEETDGALGGVEAGPDGAQELSRSGIAAALRRHAVADLLVATGVARQTLYDLRDGRTAAPTPPTLAALVAGLALLDPDRAAAGEPTLVGWRDVPAAWLATYLGLDEGAVRALRAGTRRPGEREREGLVAVVAAWRRQARRRELAERRRERTERAGERDLRRLEREERRAVAAILRDAGGIRRSVDRATGREIHRELYETLPASLRARCRREVRAFGRQNGVTLDLAAQLVDERMPWLGLDGPEALAGYFARTRFQRAAQAG